MRRLIPQDAAWAENLPTALTSNITATTTSGARRQSIRQLGGLAAGLLAAGSLAPFAALARAAAPTSAPASAARRIVCVGGALTEIIYGLNAASELVAVDTTSNYPDSVLKLPNVGYARALSAEGVLALAPTQVIASEDAGPPAVLRQLTAAGVPVAIVAANHQFEGVLERIKRIGELTGHETQATAMMRKLQQDWARARTPIEQRETQGKAKPVKVVFILAHAPNQVMVAGKETAAHAMLEYAGVSNAIATSTGFKGYKPLTPEAMIAAQPDIILVTEQGVKAAGGSDAILKFPGVEQTPAGRNRRVIAMEAMLLLGFGPRLPDALSMLDSAISKAVRA
ncbi:heme/hemin ABC transporter substrate-binding protein [Undibacterium sp. Ji49W]|uniref:heme/hemin ABC transporter substrate-binding protein n=1 Tax=Undibacterium sp. Ji49W TaxID=3413040 RepID=UPI003BF3F0D8